MMKSQKLAVATGPPHKINRLQRNHRWIRAISESHFVRLPAKPSTFHHAECAMNLLTPDDLVRLDDYRWLV
ncbi:MAG: hypothetical protein OEV91_05585, partial [Desulfobulbaceae bacterium]|nr:hypothetical protein [Desulfobulbaceae bacterium]